MAPKTKLVAFHPVHGYKIKPPQDLKTIKRNERERKRVEVVNNGFEALRKHVPTAAPVKKMSKVGILNEAMEYIQYLKTVLGASQSSEPVLLNYTQHIPAHPMPFTPYPHHSPAPASPQVPPHMQSHDQAFSPHPYHQAQASDQGFVSDYSQPSPASAWHTPQAQYTPLTPHHHHGNQQVAHVSSSSHYHNLKYHNDAESSGDEDDILDAIAEWQQQ